MPADVPDRTILYKFRSLATDKHIEFARDIILNHRLFAAPPNSFNDPFDCDTPICFEATEAEKIARAMARIKLENPSLSDEEARRCAPSRYLAAETTGLAQIRTSIEIKYGVVSLSAVIDDPLLWGHYASGHTGISIRFRAADLRHTNFFGDALAVTYQEERPIINFYRDNDDERLRKQLLTKSLSWAYEKERRIFEMNRQNRPYVTFHPSMVDAIYLGCRIDDAHRKLVREWLAMRDSFSMPRLFQARTSERKYELVFEEIPAAAAC